MLKKSIIALLIIGMIGCAIPKKSKSRSYDNKLVTSVLSEEKKQLMERFLNAFFEIDGKIEVDPEHPTELMKRDLTGLIAVGKKLFPTRFPVLLIYGESKYLLVFDRSNGRLAVLDNKRPNEGGDQSEFNITLKDTIFSRSRTILFVIECLNSNFIMLIDRSTIYYIGEPIN